MTDPLADPAVNRRGIVATLTAVVLWTCNDTCGKLASEVFPTGEMMAIRGVFAIAIAVTLVLGTGHGRILWRGAHLFLRPMVLLRALLDAVVVLTFLKALTHMQLADVTAISQATPIIMTLLAAAFGLERIGWRRFLAVLVGFSGVLLVVKPSTEGLSAYATLAVISAALVALRDLLTRYIDSVIPSAVIALVTAVAGAFTGVLLGMTEEWKPAFVGALPLSHSRRHPGDARQSFDRDRLSGRGSRRRRPFPLFQHPHRAAARIPDLRVLARPDIDDGHPPHYRKRGLHDAS